MRKILLALIGCYAGFMANGQSMHFSQYYNAPMLVNPANTALMPDDDFRLGANYRTQWATVPVPYTTFSAWSDFKIGGKKDNGHPNWLGLGGALFSDKAGDGNLSLLQMQGSAAYHLHLNSSTMLSFGGSGAYVQRSVNYDNLTFDTQWDGFTFNGHMPNGEKVGIVRTSYTTVAAGMNLAMFPNENVYIKIGGSVSNINTPTESFYGGKNTLAMRPSANVDALFRLSADFIANPSAFFQTQSGAMELVAGSLFRYNLNHGRDSRASQLILGGYDRLSDAVIGVAGYQFGDVQFMASYDFTLSALSPYNASYGALEFSIVYGGSYYKNQGIRRMFTCPRF